MKKGREVYFKGNTKTTLAKSIRKKSVSHRQVCWYPEAAMLFFWESVVEKLLSYIARY